VSSLPAAVNRARSEAHRRGFSVINFAMASLNVARRETITRDQASPFAHQSESQC